MHCIALDGIGKTALKFEEILQNDRRTVYVLSKMQSVAISHCFVTFCTQRQRNEQRKYNARLKSRCTRSVAVAAKICVIKLTKTVLK